MTPNDLTLLDATEQAARVRSRAVSAREITEATLTRIEELEPTINAFRVVMAEQALAEADRIDALPDDELATLTLAGVVAAIKDDTDVAGQSTMWGSAVDRGACEKDADVVADLRRAGSIIIGKTNVPELTLWPWTASERWGVTRNPWDPNRTPGGSSGGSAAAVCTGMAAMALGSDGGGSIRYPAGLTGLVGLKPQRDRLPLGPEHASGWHGLIALGPLTRSVRDAALFLDVVASGPVATIFRDAVGGPTRPLRIAVSTNAPPGSNVTLSAARRKQVDEAAELLAGLGHDISPVDISYGLATMWQSTVRLLKGAQQDVASLPDRGALEPRTRAVAAMGRLIPNRSLRRALEREQAVAESIDRVFDNADVVLTPLCATSAPSIEHCPSRGIIRSFRSTNTAAWLVPWNLTGQPAVAIPTGVDVDGMPTAIQLAAQAGDEATMLAVAAQIEEAQPFQRWTENAMPRHP